MAYDADLDAGRDSWTSRLGHAGMGAVRVALLFGMAGVALALILTPIAERRSRPEFAQFGAPFGIDPITTSSTKRPETYTIRRSVLNPGRNAFCIIGADGSVSGDC